MSLHKQRAGVWSRTGSSVLSSLFFLGILVFVALIAEMHPWRLDLTETGRHSLSAQTLNVLRSLDESVEIKAFFQTATPEEAQARELLETYRYHGDRIGYRFIDPDRRPEMARRHEIRTYGSLVLEGFGRSRTISHADEQSITNALLKLSREEEKKVYFLTGHGERPAEMGDKEGIFAARSALERESYRVEDLLLMQKQAVPRDASLVIIASPGKPLFPEEVERLDAYVKGGGRLMMLLDPFHDGGLKEFLLSYGIELREDVIVDESVGLFGGSALMPVVLTYGAHPITDNFAFATFYPEARSLGILEDLPRGVHVLPLAMTSENAWGETDMEMLQEGMVNHDPQTDHEGPLNIAVLAEVHATEKDAGADDPHVEPSGIAPPMGRVLVVGDGDFVSDGYFSLSGNGDLFLNMVGFLAEEEDLITIERRETQGQPLLLSEAQFRLIVWTVLVFVPLLMVPAGFIMYRVRRRQR